MRNRRWQESHSINTINLPTSYQECFACRPEKAHSDISKAYSEQQRRDRSMRGGVCARMETSSGILTLIPLERPSHAPEHDDSGGW